MRSRTKVAAEAATSGAEGADESVRQAMKKIDKAAAKGVIHPNAAARRNSRLAKRLNSLNQG